MIQGLLRAEPAVVQDKRGMLSLWAHEAMRVFQDRLVCSDDTGWFRAQLEERLRSVRARTALRP